MTHDNQTRFYDYNQIQFFKEGFSYYEIVQSNIDTRSKISASDVAAMFYVVNDTESSLMLDIDNKWRIKNNAIIEYLPLTTKNKLSIRIYRDIDNLPHFPHIKNWFFTTFSLVTY